MLIFSFLATIKSEGIEKNDSSREVVNEYFDSINKKDISKINQIITDQDEANLLSTKLNYIDKITLKSLERETNNSLLKSYTKYSKKSIDNIRIYKVKYKIDYTTPKNINNSYESWIYLCRDNHSSKWLIDIFDM